MRMRMIFKADWAYQGARQCRTVPSKMGPRSLCVSSIINRANRAKAVQLRVVSFLWCPRILGEVDLLTILKLILIDLVRA